MVHHAALYVAAFRAEIWVFSQYVSLFMYSRETEAQQFSFGLAMANMHVLYAHEMSLTFRIESLTPAERWEKAHHEDEMITVYHAESSVVEPVLIKDLVHNPTPYANRGWCIAEMEWSSDRQETAQNQKIDIRRDTAGWARAAGPSPDITRRLHSEDGHSRVHPSLRCKCCSTPPRKDLSGESHEKRIAEPGRAAEK